MGVISSMKLSSRQKWLQLLLACCRTWYNIAFIFHDFFKVTKKVSEFYNAPGVSIYTYTRCQILGLCQFMKQKRETISPLAKEEFWSGSKYFFKAWRHSGWQIIMNPPLYIDDWSKSISGFLKHTSMTGTKFNQQNKGAVIPMLYSDIWKMHFA